MPGIHNVPNQERPTDRLLPKTNVTLFVRSNTGISWWPRKSFWSPWLSIANMLPKTRFLTKLTEVYHQNNSQHFPRSISLFFFFFISGISFVLNPVVLCLSRWSPRRKLLPWTRIGVEYRSICWTWRLSRPAGWQHEVSWLLFTKMR